MTEGAGGARARWYKRGNDGETGKSGYFEEALKGETERDRGGGTSASVTEDCTN